MRIAFLAIVLAIFFSCQDDGVSSEPADLSSIGNSSSINSSSEDISSSGFSSSLVISSEASSSSMVNSSTSDQDSVFVDSRNNRTYRTVVIGNQTWMAENLDYLPSVQDSSDYSETEPRYYVYGYRGGSVVEAKQTEHYRTYGVLYNWHAANTACPANWHLPDSTEWENLFAIAGNGTIEVALSLRILSWNISPYFSNTDSLGFSALPGGIFGGLRFRLVGEAGVWWSSTPKNNLNAYGFYMDDYSTVGIFESSSNYYGQSVRCIKNSINRDLML